MKNILRKMLLGLGLLSACGAFESASAANIKIDARVPGYSDRGDGWVQVCPELRAQLGGRVVWDNARKSYVSDRVSTGETMRISITASVARELCQRGAFEGITSPFHFNAVQLPYVDTRFAASTADNVYVYAITSAGLFEKRIPRGSRPK